MIKSDYPLIGTLIEERKKTAESYSRLEQIAQEDEDRTLRSASVAVSQNVSKPFQEIVEQSLEAFLSLFKFELKNCGLPENLFNLRFSKSLKQLLSDQEVRILLSNAFSSNEELDWRLLRERWRLLSAVSVPVSFEWNQLSRNYVRRVKTIISNSEKTPSVPSKIVKEENARTNKQSKLSKKDIAIERANKAFREIKLKNQYFISYSRRDTKGVIRLVDELEGEGISVWIDQRNIPAGEKWDFHIQSALEICTGMIVILSTNSVKSDAVLDEVNYALGERKKIIPVLLDSCQVPFRLRRLQHINLTQEYDRELNRLIQDIRTH